MAQVKYRAVARVGEYQKDGQTKARWQEVGVVMATDKGHILLLEPWFNPAGLPRDGDKAVLSLFPPQEGGSRGQSNAQHSSSQGTQQGGGFATPDGQGGDDFDSDVPF
jgi:hypothetical protein